MTKLAADQESALRKLVSRQTLSADQADAVRDAFTSTTNEPVRVAEVLGYIGAALLLAGASLVVSTSWDQLTHTGRVGLLAAVTVVLAGAATGVHLRAKGTRAVRDRVASVLFALAAVAGGLTGATWAEDEHPTLLGGAAGLVLGALAYVVLPAVPALLAAAVASFVGTIGLSDLFGYAALGTGLLLLGLGVVWGLLAGVIRHRALGLGIGAAIALVGTQFPVGQHTSLAYGGTFVLAIVCFSLYLANRTAVLLAAGVAGVTVAVPEAVWDWTAGTVNAALLVLVAGLVLLAGAGIGLRLRGSRIPDPRH
jgi:hypothetical protein